MADVKVEIDAADVKVEEVEEIPNHSNKPSVTVKVEAGTLRALNLK